MLCLILIKFIYLRMDYMINIHTDRLLIRDHIKEDLHSHFKLLTDQEVMFYLPAIRCTTLDDARKHLNLCISYSSQSHRKYYFLRIEDRLTGKHIGEAGFTVLEKTGTAGYFINKKHWGKGYASEALGALIHFAFMALSLEMMVCGCVKQNTRSEKVMINNRMELHKDYVTDHGIARLEYMISFEKWKRSQSTSEKYFYTTN
ncbi:hypothetical protein AWI31_21050 [Enterobacter hormaechei subsp. xiangfangensis]|nr:hypothetical protein AWI31_21050 [Enterobacter hormaechei subsp. xiangfangensis]